MLIYVNDCVAKDKYEASPMSKKKQTLKKSCLFFDLFMYINNRLLFNY